MTSTNNTFSTPGSEMLPRTAVISLVILGGAWSLPTYDGGGIDTGPESQDLSFAESLLDFASSTTFEWGFPNDDNSIEEDVSGAEESEAGAFQVLQAEEDAELSSPEIEEIEEFEIEGDTDIQEIVQPNDADSKNDPTEEGSNDTIHGTNLRIETGLFFDASKGGEESCDESDYDYDDDCDDDDGERGLLKKILFFLPSSVQPKPNTTNDASNSSSIGQMEIAYPTNISSVINNTTETDVSEPSGFLAVSNSSTRQPKPNLDEILQLMESLAPRNSISWLAALLFLV